MFITPATSTCAHFSHLMNCLHTVSPKPTTHKLSFTAGKQQLCSCLRPRSSSKYCQYQRTVSSSAPCNDSTAAYATIDRRFVPMPARAICIQIQSILSQIATLRTCCSSFQRPSSLQKTPAAPAPSAIIIAPVSVAQSSTACGLNSSL